MVVLDYLEPEVDRLRVEVVTLGQILETAVFDSVDVLRRQASPTAHSDPRGTEPLITLDHQITKRRFAIEMDCLALIVTHQPVNGDLRVIVSMLEIVTELEHIGQYVTDIARVHFMLARVDDSLGELLVGVRDIAIQTQGMLHRGLDAFLQQDCDLARAVHRDDQIVDDLYSQFYQNMLIFMRGKSRTKIKQARYLTQIARNLERAADRVSNICEWVVFASTGRMNGIDQLRIDLLQEEMV